MTAKERITKTLAHEEPDRVPICDAPWTSTVDKWRAEGFLLDTDASDYFDYEMKWLFPDNTPRFPYRILEETREYVIETNCYGETVKNFKNRSTTPYILKSPVKDRSDWNKIKDLKAIGISEKASEKLIKAYQIEPYDEKISNID